MLNHQRLTDSLVPILRPLLAQGTPDYPLVLANQDNSKIASSPFATIQILRVNTMGTLETGCIFEGLGMQVKMQATMVIRINTFADFAIERIHNLVLGLSFPSISEKFCGLNMGFIDAEEVRDITALSNCAYEQRATTDLNFNIAIGDLSQTTQTDTSLFDPVDPVHSVRVTSTLGSYNSEFLVTKDD